MAVVDEGNADLLPGIFVQSKAEVVPPCRGAVGAVEDNVAQGDGEALLVAARGGHLDHQLLAAGVLEGVGTEGERIALGGNAHCGGDDPAVAVAALVDGRHRRQGVVAGLHQRDHPSRPEEGQVGHIRVVVGVHHPALGQSAHLARDGNAFKILGKEVLGLHGGTEGQGCQKGNNPMLHIQYRLSFTS